MPHFYHQSSSHGRSCGSWVELYNLPPGKGTEIFGTSNSVYHRHVKQNTPKLPTYCLIPIQNLPWFSLDSVIGITVLYASQTGNLRVTFNFFPALLSPPCPVCQVVSCVLPQTSHLEFACLLCRDPSSLFLAIAPLPAMGLASKTQPTAQKSSSALHCAIVVLWTLADHK